MALDDHDSLRDSYPGLLVDKDIKRLIHIEPFAEGIKRDGVISYGLTSCGYDVRLGTRFKLFNGNYTGVIDPKNLNQDAFITFERSEAVFIPGGGYLLGESVEEFIIPRNIAVLCIGKSTYARVGCSINVTPGEPEWKGRWTIEIENASPVPMCVYPNEGIMQCLFIRTVGTCEVSYADKKGKYQNDQGLRLAAVDQVK
jgi:dCTP deaminase